MIFSPASSLTAVVSLLFLGLGGVNADSCVGASNTIGSFCNAQNDLGPNGFLLFCIYLDLAGILGDLRDNNEEDFTIFAPTNQAFEVYSALVPTLPEAEFNSILLYHIVEGSILPPNDLLCTSFVPVSGNIFGGRFPKIRCVDDIVGQKNSFIVGPANKADLGNLPQLSQGGKVRSAERCNGIIYGVDNVILPKFVAEFIKEGQGCGGVCG